MLLWAHMDQATYEREITASAATPITAPMPSPDPRVQSGIPLPEDNGWTRDSSGLPEPEPIEESDDEGDCSEETTAKYRRGVIAVLTCKSHRAAAQQIGISCRQLSNWKAEPLFRELLEKTKQELYGDAVRAMRTALMDSCIEGARVIRDIANNPHCTDGARVQAGKALVDYAIELHDIAQIKKDIQLLKGSVNETVGNGKTFERLE
jgi:hypothetical protein